VAEQTVSRRAVLAGFGGAAVAGLAGGLLGSHRAEAAASDLPRWFDRRFGQWVAGDIPRAYELDGGRTLWVTNDSFLSADRTARTIEEATFQRNAAFTERRGRLGLIHSPGEPFLPNDSGSHFDQWWWFHGAVNVGDRLEVFVSLMRRTGELGWAINFTYAETWIATISGRDGSILDLRPAPNRGTEPLYGFSVASDDDFTYLFGNTARYFTDWATNYLARVPFGEVDQPPTYWDGWGWSPNAVDAAPIHVGTSATCRMHVVRRGPEWWATHKRDEFFGNEIELLRAAAPTGPWTVAGRLPTPTISGDGRTCTYDAQARLVDDNTLRVWWSNNAYAEDDVRNQAEWYRPTQRLIDIPSLGFL
jgi:hypothetical protein